MEKNKSKAKKGMTLIEVIVSVALLSILIVPLSGLVMSSLKNNKNSEHKQQANYVGQKILEELKAYDEITLKDGSGTKYFELLDGDKIFKDLGKDTFKGNFKRTIYGMVSEAETPKEIVYNVDVEIEKDNNFKYDDDNNLNKYNNADFRFDFFYESGMNKIQLVSESNASSVTVTNDLIIELEKKSNNLELKLFEKNNKAPIISSLKSDSINNKILLSLNSNYNRNTNIEIKSNMDESIEIHLIKEKDATGKLSLSSSGGNVILYEEDEIEANPIADMYKYNVMVKDDDNKVLFEGYSSKNVNIK